MTAAEILAAIRKHHSKAAIVAEVVVDNPNWREAYQETGKWGNFNRRIDAFMVLGKQRTAIEIKVTRSDFFRDTEAKREPWRRITHRFVYATPQGLLRPEEIPDGCGLWEVGERVKVVKRAAINKDVQPIPDQVFIAMCYRAMRIDQRGTTV